MKTAVTVTVKTAVTVTIKRAVTVTMKTAVTVTIKTAVTVTATTTTVTVSNQKAETRPRPDVVVGGSPKTYVANVIARSVPGSVRLGPVSTEGLIAHTIMSTHSDIFPGVRIKFTGGRVRV